MIDEAVLLLTFSSDDPLRRVPRVRSFLTRIGFNVAPTGQFDKYYEEPLEKIFSRVVTYEYTKRILEVGLTGANREVVGIVKTVRPKYVFWLSSFYDILPWTLDAIRREGAIVVGWFFDDEMAFDNYSKTLIGHIDYFVTNDREAVRKYRELDARALFALPCVGERVERPPEPQKSHGVVFVGRRQPSRDSHFEAWKKTGLTIETFGPGWESGPISRERMLEIFRTSKINLNISIAYSPRTGQVRQLKARPFEVCLAGGFLLTDDAPGLSEYFEVGREIVRYSSEADMVEKCRYYLANDAEREAIALRGWERANAEYTSSEVIGEIAESIEADQTDPRPLPPPTESADYKRGVSACLLLWAAIFIVAGRPRLCLDALSLCSRYPGSTARFLVSFLAGGTRR
jgi:spore maturation protein CgeB